MRVMEAMRSSGSQKKRRTREEHMKLVRFEDEYGMETYVNPDQVTHIRAHGESTTIHFSSDKHMMTVKMAASAVASMFASTESLGEKLEAIGASGR